MVSRQMGEILARRPLVRPRPRVERARRRPREDEGERLELALEARQERSGDGHGSLRGETGQLTRLTTPRVSPWTPSAPADARA